MSAQQQSLARRIHFKDDLGVTVGGGMTLIVSALIVIVMAIGVVVIFASRSYGRTQCANWSTQTGFQSKFVILNWADGGTCLAKTPQGLWVKNTQIVQFIQGTKP